LYLALAYSALSYEQKTIKRFPPEEEMDEKERQARREAAADRIFPMP
jgi:hypothetical protein